MSTRRLRTAAYSDDARRRLGEAVVRAREAAGYKFRTTFAKAAGIQSMRSLELLEAGDPGVGQSILFAVARALPGWTEDTPRVILEGGAAPIPTAFHGGMPDPEPGEPHYEVPAIYHADHWTLLEIARDPSRLGTEEYFIALGILWADKKISAEVLEFADRIGRQAQKARLVADQAKAERDREIADLQQSLTERIRPELSG